MVQWRRAWVPLGVAWMLAVGCGPDDPPPSGMQTGGQDSGDTTTTSDSASGTSGVDTTAATTTGGGMEQSLARGGIRVDWVQANQGVGVDIGRDGGPVGPADRATRLIKDRVTLIRAFWTLPDDWQPRELEGRLIVTYADGSSETFYDRKVVEETAFEGDLSRCFFWGLMPDQTQPGITYRVELYETSDEWDDLPEGNAPPILPVDGTSTFVGIEDSYQVLKVVLVPFNYDDGEGCSTEPDTSESTMQLFQDLIYMQNPIDRLDFQIHEPIEWDTALESFVPINVHMSALRFEEGAPPETYYYGLIDVCAGGLGGAGGLAHGIPSDPVTEGAAAQRVSSGLSLDPDWSSETFVHEVGHSQGRRHVTCNGEEGGPNPSYPFEGGDVGEWGFGVIDFGLRHPTFYKDYMTYCHPTWVGTWGWNRVYPVIEGLSAWDMMGSEAPEDPYGTSLLMGAIEESGKEYWVTVPGSLPESAERGGATVELRTEGKTVDVPAHVQSMPEGVGRLIMAPLPERWSEVDTVTVVEGSDRRTVPRATISEHHRSRSVKR